ncbi:hypothetical protein GW846_04600 [Candidatus Gracilibacteria bacterium]|nr:hypothetical protein [Candidatus Gracilibacteria bacterium]
MAGAVDNTIRSNNVNIGGSIGSESSNLGQNDPLEEFGDSGQFIGVSSGGESGIYNTMIRIARDIKNLFYAIATVLFLIISLRLIFSSNTEEEIGNFKKGIIWITIGLIVMQIAYSFAIVTFDQGVSASLGVSIIQNIAYPLINLIKTLASVFFIAMAIFAFFRLVTANGNEEAIKSGKMTIVYAIFGFIIVKLADEIVQAFYGRIDCNNTSGGFINTQANNCINRSDISEGIYIITNILNWLNGFVAIVVLIMIIYAGLQIMLSGGDEEKIKKGKQSIIYIAIGIAILIVNYLVLTFFLVPQGTI